MSEALTAYTQEFDPRMYRAIKEGPATEYLERKQSLDLYTTTQIQTLLGERYRILESKFNYDILDGKLYGQNMDEPAIESFKRGRDYRRAIGNGVDFAREEAEVRGYEVVDSFMTDPNTPEGAMMLSISLKGKDQAEKKSSYRHNFYDIFVKKNGYVEAKRFSSALDSEDYSRRLGFDEVFDDVYLLEHPINISGIFSSPDDVHKFLHEDHDYMDEATFRDRILVEVAPFIANYIRACAEDGEAAQRLAFNAIINVADEVKRRIANEAYGIYQDKIQYSAGAVVNYGLQKVEVIPGGCGNVEGFTFDEGGFRVSDFDPSKQDQYGNLEVKCPACRAISIRPRGQLLDKCSNDACSNPKAIACKP